MAPVFFAKVARGERTLCLGMQCGGFSGFAALCCDVRRLLRGAGVCLATLIALRRLRTGR